MKLGILILIASLAASGQSEVRMAQKNTDTGYELVLGYSGTNLIYVCRAPSQQPTSQPISIASATNANPVVFTVTAGHGFYLASLNLPTVTISGGTGNWTAVNGTFVATPILSTSFSIPVNSTAFGAVTGTLTYTTRAPLITSRIWSVQAFSFDGSSNMTWSGWSNGTSAQTQTCTGSPAAAQ